MLMNDEDYLLSQLVQTLTGQINSL
jgi:hypothetical protein